MALKFPDGWPKDCPPNDAIDATGDVFRIVKNKPPNNDDMASHHESGKLPNANPCLRCGLSVLQELGDAIHQRKLLPKLGKLIAKCTLEAVNGKVKPTSGAQPTHMTWWPYEGVARAQLFVVVNEDV